MTKPRIWVDFQNSDPQGRVRLTCVGTVKDLSRQGLVLSEGLEVVLWCREFEADATVTFSEEEQVWAAHADWDNIRDLDNE